MSFTTTPTLGPTPAFPQIDYTDKDYVAYRQALIDIAPTNVPEWTSRSESDFLMALIELFSYIGDIQSYYIDRVANEAYLPTAQLRSSVLNIAALMDYQPAPVTASQAVVQFTIRTGTGPLVISKGTQVAVPATLAQDQIIFETQADLTIYGANPPNFTDSFTGTGAAGQFFPLSRPYNGSGAVVQVAGVTWALVTSLTGQGAAQVYTLTQAGPVWTLAFGDGAGNGAKPGNGATITAVYGPPITVASYAGSINTLQGVTVNNEPLGISSGGIDQDFTLFQSPVVGGTVQVYVDEGLGPQPWNNYSHLSDALSSDPAYTTLVDANGTTHIVFGDGVNGRIPAVQANVFATYRKGGGVMGDVGSNTITQLVNPIANVLTVTNPSPAVGGADAESLDHIRQQAPKSLTAINRAVTTADYAALALKVPGVAKANAIAAVYTSVTLYVHPIGGFLPTTGTGPTLQSMTSALVPSLTNPLTGSGYLDPRDMAGQTITVLPPQYQGGPGYVPVNITATINVIDTMAASVVQAQVNTALANLLSFDNVNFGSRVALSSIYQTIIGVTGVNYVVVNYLWRADQVAQAADVVCAPSEMPTLGNITLATTGGIPV